MAPIRWSVLFVATLAPLATTGHALDRPISAVKLVLKRSPSAKEKLVFVSKDPAFLFPAIGSADDPASGSPGGALLEVFSKTEGAAALAIPPGIGKPGWKVKDATGDRYTFSNKAAPLGISVVKAATLKSGTTLKVVARETGVALAGAQGSVGVRITTGTLRSCVLFDASTIQKDEPGVFTARNAVASALADCSDGALSGLPPCGSAAFPTCGGACGAGETCEPFQLFNWFPPDAPEILIKVDDGCACVPAGATCTGSLNACNMGPCGPGLACSFAPAAPNPMGGFGDAQCGCSSTS